MTEGKEGELYKSVEIEGARFDIYYGYASEQEKKSGWEPTPQYPDFDNEPQFAENGYRFTVAYGQVCEHYEPISTTTDFIYCHNCKLFDKKEEYIGVCLCEKRRRGYTEKKNE